MVKYQEQSKDKKEYYEKMLKLIGSLSRLFSENDIPYYDYRIAENLYCKSFNATNVGRDGTSVDATSGALGIGIKTFAGNSAQKVAEFNRTLLEFSNLKGIDKAIKIANLRNKRIEFTKNAYGLTDMIYHCIRREKNKMFISETPMETIQIENIKILADTPKSIKFTDSINNYIFNASKSVLLKDFPKKSILAEINIKILEDPFSMLEKNITILGATDVHQNESIKLPLYTKEKNVFIVPEKSGLNQWNAGGRKRNPDEIYIKIPLWIHKYFPSFFPKTKFNLHLPDRTVISAKICQANGKALMSDPNKILGEWLLRKVLKLKYGQLLRYNDLQEIGIDSVVLIKKDLNNFHIDFQVEGEFEKFEEENRTKFGK